MKKFKFLQSAQITSDLWRYRMNSFQINSSKAYFIVGMMLLLLVVSFFMYNQVQAAPGDASSFESANTSHGYCSASRSLVHRAVLRRLQRLDFALSDGRGNALGLRSGDEPNENGAQSRNLQRLDFAWSDGRGNALGLRSGDVPNENGAQSRNLQRLVFAWSDGRGNALGIRDSNISLANNVLAAICLNHGE